MSQALVVGIDVAKKDFAVACRVGEAETELGKFADDASGYALLQAALKDEGTKRGMKQIQLIVEATRGYEAALLVYAYAQDWWVSMPRPKGSRPKMRDWAKGVGYRVKTAPSGPPVDARMLAHYGVERRPPATTAGTGGSAPGQPAQTAAGAQRAPRAVPAPSADAPVGNGGPTGLGTPSRGEFAPTH